MSLHSVTEKSIEKLYTICLKNNIPFVSYSLPGSLKKTTLIQYTKHPREISVKNGIQNIQGFVFSPFIEVPEFPTYLLEPDILFSGNNVKEEILSTLESISAFHNVAIKIKPKEESTHKKEYIHSVDQIHWLLTNSELNKLVLSRVLYTQTSSNRDIETQLQTLFTKFPSAFRYIINIPNEGIWIGASPEPLMIIKNNEAGLVSLAGTQKINGVPVNQLKWNRKELNEQYIVSDYIETVLHQNGINKYISKGPISASAANVVHLQTQFTFPASLVEDKTGEFLVSLHPTPSISGMPKKKALELIPEFEKHQRRYYTGFLGPINFNGDTNLFINLRCMRIAEDITGLYAGAGITEGSIAESEWEETNQKLGAMLSLLI